MKSVYLIGSLRNEKIPEIAESLRTVVPDVFDDWYAAGPEADDYWKKYERNRGHSYAEALEGYAARHVFSFDKHHLDRCDAAVLALPAGKSGHLELGYFIGTGRPGYILLDGVDDRFDVMYQFATKIFTDKDEMLGYFGQIQGTGEEDNVVVTGSNPPDGEGPTTGLTTFKWRYTDAPYSRIYGA